jgi:hypothetical protein
MMQQSAMMHRDPNRQAKVKEENCHVAKLLHMLDHSDVNVVYHMLLLAKRHLTHECSGPDRTVYTLSAWVYAAFRLARRVLYIERNPSVVATEPQPENNQVLTETSIEANKSSNADAEVHGDGQNNETTATVKEPVRYAFIHVFCSL